MVAKEYFSRLLNKAIDEDTLIVLSSAQSARAHSWLKSNNFIVDDLILARGFTLRKLIGAVPKDSIEERAGTNKVKQKNSGFYNCDNSCIGIDIQCISELFPLGLPIDLKVDEDLLGIFTSKELSYAQSKDQPLQTLTGIFAAKEAAKKCSKNKFNFTDLEILPNKNGTPHADGFSISISHSQDYAVAIATVNKEENTSHDVSMQELGKIEIKPLDQSKCSPLNSIGSFIIPITLTLLLLLELMRFLGIIKL